MMRSQPDSVETAAAKGLAESAAVATTASTALASGVAAGTVADVVSRLRAIGSAFFYCSFFGKIEDPFVGGFAKNGQSFVRKIMIVLSNKRSLFHHAPFIFSFGLFVLIIWVPSLMIRR